jgi:hypothetical protein
MRTTALAATAAVLLALAACGGDDSSGDDTTPATSATTAESAETTEPDADATTEAPADTTASDDTEAPGDTEAPDDTETPDDTDAPEGALDVCALLTPADLEAAFGGVWEAGSLTHQEQTGADQCVWGNVDVPPVKTFSIVIYREGHLNPAWEDNGLTVASLFEQTKEVYEVEEELELGDEAYRAGSTIAVLDGDVSYSFDTFLGTSDEALAGLRKLAEQVVAAGI